MILIKGLKLLSMGFITITLGGGAIGTGILFAGYIVAAGRNPEEKETLFNTTLMAFALIETFVFFGFGAIAIIFLL